MHQAKDLYYLSTELIDMKVDMATSKAMDRVIEQMRELKTEIKTEMHNGFAEIKSEMHILENRLTAVETKLGMVNASQKEIRNRLIEYLFRGGWLIFCIGLSYLMMHFH